MYPKNTASPRPLYAKVVKAADGSAIISGVVAYHVQGVTRAAVSGTAAAHIANGLWTYTPTQGETNYDAFTIEFYHADAVANGPAVCVYTSTDVVQTGDCYVRLGAPAGASISADIAAIAAVSGGSGARTVEITVNDGVSPLESAKVRVTKGAETYVLQTDALGQCTFYLDDGTWNLAITLAGYTHAGSSVVVDGDEAVVESMTSVAISVPASPDCTTGYAVCIGTDGLPEEGVTIQAQMTAGRGTAGYALDRGVITMTSDANGYVEHTGFVQGAKYRFRRGSDSWGVARLAPSAATWALNEILGKS